MDRKLRKRRKTTEGPFSENIEKKKKKSRRKTTEGPYSEKMEEKKRKKTRKRGSHLRVA